LQNDGQGDIFQSDCLIRPAFSTDLLSVHYFPVTHFHRPRPLLASSSQQSIISTSSSD